MAFLLEPGSGRAGGSRPEAALVRETRVFLSDAVSMRRSPKRPHARLIACPGATPSCETHS